MHQKSAWKRSAWAALMRTRQKYARSSNAYFLVGWLILDAPSVIFIFGLGQNKIRNRVHLICNLYHMYPQNKWHTFFMKYAPVSSVSNYFFRSRIAIHIWYCTRITSISHFFQFRCSQRNIREVICNFSNVTCNSFQVDAHWLLLKNQSKERFEFTSQ